MWSKLIYLADGDAPVDDVLVDVSRELYSRTRFPFPFTFPFATAIAYKRSLTNILQQPFNMHIGE